MKAIVFQPHNDDGVISIGGITQKLIKAGWIVKYVYMTDGRHGSNIMPPEETIKVRAEEAEEERKFLGILNFHDFGIEDGKLAKLDHRKLEKIKNKILEILAEETPCVIFIPLKSDMHTDHRITHDIVTNIINKNKLGVLIAKYFVWLFPDFYDKTIDPAEMVLAVDVSEEMDKKLRAVRLHKSQVREGYYDKMIEKVNSLFSLLFNVYRKTDTTYLEIIGLYNLKVDNGTKLKSLIKVLGKVEDVTKIFHGRKSEKIET